MGAKAENSACRNPENFPMPETDLAANVQATALAAMLESARTRTSLTNYSGALTPRELDAREMEIAALASGAGHSRPGLDAARRGARADRFRWLSGMVTNTVNDLFPNTGAWNWCSTRRAIIQGDLTVWRGGEEKSPHGGAAESQRALRWSRSSGRYAVCR
jgi:hypothetical protein